MAAVSEHPLDEHPLDDPQLDDRGPSPMPVGAGRWAVTAGGAVTAFELRGSKLRPIIPRLGVVRRPALLKRLDDGDRPVTTIIAPAGYGKSTLVAQWVHHGGGPVAWLSTDDDDNDPAVLCTYLAAALDRCEPLDAGVFSVLASNRPTAALVTALLASLEHLRQPV